MKAKTLIELLTLSTNVYMITKDEKMMHNLSEMVQKGKEKLSGMAEEWGLDENEEKLMEKFAQKAHQAKEELEHKMEEVAKKVYEKVNLVHTDKIKELENTIASLQQRLSKVEAPVK